MATRYSQPNIDIDTLKLKTGVTDTQLDQKIEHEKLWSLAGLLGSVPEFDLTKADIADVKDCASKHGNQQAIYEVLRNWEDVIYDFTYRSLLELLISRREGALAEQVCRTFIQTQASEQNKEDAVSLSPAPGPKSAVPLIRDPVEPSSLVTGTTTADCIKGFDKRFRDLRKISLKEITEKGVTVNDFRQTLMNLPYAIANENEEFITSKYSLFKKAESIEDIFLYLNFYLSYIDFSLLEHIIEQFGSDSLKRDMSSYADDMRQFRMKTPVSEALDHLPKISYAPVDYSRLTVKFDFDVHTATLEDLETCRKRFASEFLLSQLALSLSDLQESSLLVTWLVPAALGAMISDQVQKKSSSFFLSNSILKLSLEGECLYPPMPMSMVSQSGKGESSGPVIEAGVGKPGLTSLKPHKRMETHSRLQGSTKEPDTGSPRLKQLTSENENMIHSLWDTLLLYEACDMALVTSSAASLRYIHSPTVLLQQQQQQVVGCLYSVPVTVEDERVASPLPPSSPQTSSVPSELTLSVLDKELKTLTKPIQFGISLGIPQHQLEVIQLNNRNDTEGQKIALFQFIAKNHKSLGITWSIIADTLRDIDYGDLSSVVRGKYCTST